MMRTALLGAVALACALTLPAAARAASTTYTGIIQVALTITVKSAVPAGQDVTCLATVSANDAAFTGSYIEQAGATASRGTGSATCTVSVPYRWTLGSGAGYSVGYSITTTSPSSGLLRTTNFNSTSASPMPTNNTVTTLRFAAVF